MGARSNQSAGGKEPNARSWSILLASASRSSAAFTPTLGSGAFDDCGVGGGGGIVVAGELTPVSSSFPTLPFCFSFLLRRFLRQTTSAAIERKRKTAAPPPPVIAATGEETKSGGGRGVIGAGDGDEEVLELATETAIEGVDSSTMPFGISALATAADWSDGASMALVPCAAACEDASMVTVRRTDAALISSETTRFSTSAAAAKLLMIASRAAAWKSSTAPDAIMLTTMWYSGRSGVGGGE